MALIVQKYGGSSVADAEKIKDVARRVAEQAPGNQLVVVVSAMGKATDGLISLARQVAPTPLSERWTCSCLPRHCSLLEV
jgi:aspartate kinase